MITSLKRGGIYEVSIGLGKESYANDNDQINSGDRYFGAICLALSASLHYLNGSAEYPKDIWTKLDGTFGKNNEEHNNTLEITSSTRRFLYSKFSASTLSDEVVQYEDEVESSTHSIRIEESLHAMTPPNAPEVHEISDISSPHIAETK